LFVSWALAVKVKLLVSKGEKSEIQKMVLGMSKESSPLDFRSALGRDTVANQSVPPYEVRGAAGDVKPTHEFEGWPAFSGYSVSAIKTPGLLISTIKTPEPYL